MSYDDLDLYNPNKAAFKYEKRGNPVDVEAEKVIHDNQAELVANKDMAKEYDILVNDTIDKGLSVDEAFNITPPAQPVDMLVQEHMDNNFPIIQ